MVKTEKDKTNILIAEFMGLTIITDDISLFDTNYKPLGKYDESWDLLMTVIEKIVEVIGVKSVDECSEKEWYITTNLTRLTITTPKEAVYNAVLEFVKWYKNESK